jgi:hypothetical protein
MKKDHIMSKDITETELEETPIHIPEGYDAIFLLVGYDADNELVFAEADHDWSYTDEIIFSKEPERYVFLKKKQNKQARKPISVLYLENGKVFSSLEESKGIKPKRKFF